MRVSSRLPCQAGLAAPCPVWCLHEHMRVQGMPVLQHPSTEHRGQVWGPGFHAGIASKDLPSTMSRRRALCLSLPCRVPPTNHPLCTRTAPTAWQAHLLAQLAVLCRQLGDGC